MTQIKNVTTKEMQRRTGTNALGYSYPDKDTILLRKGLTGKLKREVLDHEINHLENGEEGPFLGLVAGGLSALSSLGQMGQRERMLAESQKYMQPYREFGGRQLSGLEDWLSAGGMTPTMEEVQAGPGYATRLGAVESSAAARGGLLSGNALRDIGEFGASEYEREQGRRGQEFSRRMQMAGLGYGAAGQSAGLTAGATPGIANAMGDIGAGLAGGLGAYQGQQNWQQMMKPRTYGGYKETTYGGGRGGPFG